MIDLLVFLGILAGILLGVGWLIGGVVGITIGLALAVLINLFAYWYSDRVVLRMYRARKSTHLDLQNMVKDLSKDARIPTPQLYSIQNDAPNAFATGRSPDHSAIAYTTGLLRLDDGEIGGVLAHEISHIKHRDTLIQVIAATIAGAIAFIAQIGYWSLFLHGNSRGQGSILGLVLIIIFAPLAALLIRLAISRNREYKADYGGVLLTRNPLGLASALKKISDYAKERPFKGSSSATSHLFIVNPFRGDWFNSLFATHPPTEERIRRLKEM
jgi:heat shock protein HtpX